MREPQARRQKRPPRLERVIEQPRKKLWIVLFVLGTVIVGLMATSYNFELFRTLPSVPLAKVIFGALGFVGILAAFVLFFARLLKEMKINQLQSEFLDRISHELRTPLSTMTLVSDLLKGSSLSEADRLKLWASHGAELERLNKDVELLLQAARLRASKIEPKMKRIDLNFWLRSISERMRFLAGSNIALEIEHAEGELFAEIDSDLLDMIVQNLLDNAKKFSMGKPHVTIRTSKEVSGFPFYRQFWSLEVIDEGRGFNPDQRQQLFRRFSRILPEKREYQKDSVPGTGLGLYLSATAAKSMNLSLEGESLGEGQGARFVIRGRCQ